MNDQPLFVTKCRGLVKFSKDFLNNHCTCYKTPKYVYLIVGSDHHKKTRSLSEVSNDSI